MPGREIVQSAGSQYEKVTSEGSRAKPDGQVQWKRVGRGTAALRDPKVTGTTTVKAAPPTVVESDQAKRARVAIQKKRAAQITAGR
jgi:hypothetical protein